MNWIDNDTSNPLWDIGKGFFENKETYFPQICPVCGEKQVHFYAHYWKESDATMWVWCSHCKRTIHGLIRYCPTWYRNYKVIHRDKLTAYPDYLEINKTNIDLFISTFIKKFPLPPLMTSEELETLHEALSEITQNGFSDVKCPRCGKELVISNYGALNQSGEIHCANLKCIRMGWRGL